MAALWIVGCDGPATSDDAAVADGGLADGGLQGDAGPAGCETEGCDAGYACVRSVCVADCGGDLAGFDAALGAGLVPVAHFCRSAGVFATQIAGDDVSVFDVIASTEGSVTTFSLSRWALDPASPTPAPALIGSLDFDAEDSGDLAFAGGYLALSPDGAQALFGYTTSATGSPGQIFRMSLASGEGWKELAPGNFDAAWADADHYLVNGFGLGSLAEGQGLYAADLTVADRVVHLGRDLGSYSGSVAVGADFILASGVGDDFSPQTRFFSRADYEAALAGGAPIDLGARSEVLDPSGASLPSMFRLVRGRLVTMPFGGPITSYAIAIADGAMTLSDPRVLATGPTFTGVLESAGDQLLLVHAGGLLLVGE